MTSPLGNTATTDFLHEHWQRKPLLIREAIPGFSPELGADDIAGLACDELAESRLVSGSYPQHDWSLEYGPFDESRLSALPSANWTLLVQDVEKHYPPLKSLLAMFDFLPSWRIDDLMVSVAAPGGSVGPHCDQYDVFLLQAEGRRRWQIAEHFDPALRSGTELNVLESFEFEQEWVLQPGDMLYLPPGIAHHGVALDTGMTWSLGMRAPSAADLMQAYGEWLASNSGEGRRYSDPDPGPPSDPAELDPASIRRFAGLFAHDHDDFPEFLGSFLSRYRLAHDPLGPEEPLGHDDLAAALIEGRILRHNPWTRLLWLQRGEDALLFGAGSVYTCDLRIASVVCNEPALAAGSRELAEQHSGLICTLVNDGHLYLESPS